MELIPRDQHLFSLTTLLTIERNTMKFEQKTIDVLKSLTGVNPAMMFMPGNVLRVKNPAGGVIAKATLKESFDKQFCMENVPQFLNVLSLFDDKYDVDFGENGIVVKSEDGRKIKYNYTSLSLIKEVRNIKLPPEAVVSFKLTQDNLNKSLKALGILNLDHLVVAGINGELILRGEKDKESDSGNIHDVVVGTTDREFKAVFKAENLRLYPGDYEVDVYENNGAMMSHFKGQDVEYFIAVESEKSKLV